MKIPRSVIPAPYQVRGKLQAESRVPGVNRDPIFEMVPGFRRDDVWTPVFTGVTIFYETINDSDFKESKKSFWSLNIAA